jgi:transposase
MRPNSRLRLGTSKSPNCKNGTAMSQPRHIIGIDIAKEKFDYHRLKEAKGGTLPYDQAESFVESIKNDPPELVIMEHTGGYERVLATLLDAAGIPLAIVNPRQVRDYAKARNILAKTDAIDARVIAQFAVGAEITPRPLPDTAQRELQTQVARRRQLVQMQTSEKNRQQQATSSVVRASVDRVLEFLERELQDLQDKMDAYINDDATWRARETLLKTIPGVGPQTARSLTAFLPELGTLNRQAIASLAGLAPRNRDSGQWRGARSIGGGRREVRASLYMSCLTAIRHNMVIKRHYEHLVSQGKKRMVAMVACMRKLLVIMNTMVKNETIFRKTA